MACSHIRRYCLIVIVACMGSLTIFAESLEIRHANGKRFHQAEVKRVDEYGLIIKYEGYKYARISIDDLSETLRSRFFPEHRVTPLATE